MTSMQTRTARWATAVTASKRNAEQVRRLLLTREVTRAPADAKASEASTSL